MVNLEARAAALTAKNIEKAKARGLTHRVEFEVANAKGGYVRTEVCYVGSEPDNKALVRLALGAGTQSIFTSVYSAKVSAL